MELFYNQRKQAETKYSCTAYTFLHMIMLDFWVKIPDTLIIKFVYYLESVGALILSQWAIFSIIYPIMTKYVNSKYWVNLEVKTNSISKWLDDISSWSLWIKKLTTMGQQLGTDDWVFTKYDVDLSMTYNNWYWHNHLWKKSNLHDRWIIVDSWNWITYECDLEVLKYWVKQGLYYDTWRAIVPKDDFTKQLQKALIYKAKKLKRTLTLEEFENVKLNII